MMLIPVVYYVIIAFLINMNVIADHASAPTKNGLSSIIVLNACSRDPPYFVSCIIGFGDVKLYRSAILDYADKSYFPYANTTNGLHVTIFKHINVQDPGTVIITKKLKDGNHCFAVSGKYSTPEISNCLKELKLNESTFLPETPDTISCTCIATRVLTIQNSVTGNELFVAFVTFKTIGVLPKTSTIHPTSATYKKEFLVDLRHQLEPWFNISIQRSDSLSQTRKTIQTPARLGERDWCLILNGSYTYPIINHIPCEVPSTTRYLTDTTKTSSTTMGTSTTGSQSQGPVYSGQ